jgi:tetratricopeptide (TPR) repeat protein
MPADHATTLMVVPPLGAYRRDLARLGVEQLTPDDGAWIAAAVSLAHLAHGEKNGRDGQLAHLAASLDAASGGQATPPLDAPNRPSPPLLRSARMLAERMEDASAWHLALSVLAVAERALEPDALDAGRIRAQRARILWKSGAVDDAEASYRELLRLGRRHEEPELLARGYIGLGAINQIRGNYPDVARWAKRAAAVAREHSLASLAALAHQFLMVSAGQRGDYGRALMHGWTAYQTAHGEPVREAEMLLNLAQLLVRMDEHHAALSGFVAALERDPPARIALPSWGGVATSASLSGNRRIASLAAERIWRLTAVPGHQYARASALAEAAVGLERVGLDAARWREAALSLAEAHGFHEISFSLTPSPSSERRPAPRERVTSSVRGLGERSTAVITAVDALADVRSSHVLA